MRKNGLKCKTTSATDGAGMASTRSVLAALLLCCVTGVLHAAETSSFTYDALGRLVRMQVSGGVRHGVQQAYEYDSAGNRTYQQTIGPANPRPSTVAPSSATLNSMGSGAVLIVNVNGASPGGSVTFAADGMFIGSAQVIDGQARIVVAGLLPGNYTITATYSGDGNNDPTISTFDVKVQDLSWLPAVLDLILLD